MSHSFKKNDFFNDLFPRPTKFAKKNRTRKIRRNKELSYCDRKITDHRIYGYSEFYYGKGYRWAMK